LRASVPSTELLQGGEELARAVWGSASTRIACVQAGRNALLMELHPLSGDLMVQRYQQFSGQTVEHREAAA
jgi:hypothetical protein